MEAEIKKWGNSKAIILSSEEAEKLELNVGDKIDFFVTKKSSISGFGMFKHLKYKPFKRQREDMDREIG